MATTESAASTPTSHAKQVLTGAGFTAVIQAVGLVINYGTQIVLARWLNSHDYGIYSYLWTWTIVLSTMLVLGFPTLGIKSVAAYNAQGEYGKTRGFLHFSLGVVGSVTGLVAGIGILGVLAFDGRVQSDYLQVLPFALAAVIPYAIILVLCDVSRGFNWAVIAFLPKLVAVPLLVFVLAALIWHFSPSMTATMVFGAVLAATWITALVNIIVLYRYAPRAVRESTPQYDTRVWIGAAFPMFLTMLFTTMINQADAIIVGFYETPESVAIYNVAKRVGLLSMALLVAISTLTAPRIATMYAKGEHAALQVLLQRLLPIFFFPSLAVTMAFIFFGDRILGAFGQTYVAGVPLLLVLMLGYLSNAAFGPCTYILSMTGHHASQARIIAVIACVTVVLGFILIPWMGVMGAALASAIGLVSLNIGQWLAGIKLTGIDGSIFCTLRRVDL